MKKIQEKLQSFAGAMMVPIVLFVLVGFYVGIGSAFTNYIIPGDNIVKTIFGMISSMGFTFMNYLPLWFSVGIAFAMAKKEKGWAAFAGIVLFMSYITCIGSYAGAQGWNADTVAVENLLSLGYSQQAALNFSALWGSVAGKFTFDMGIFSGIISGVTAGLIHNKFCEIKFKPMFAFFQGTKFVVILVTLAAVPMAIATYYVWPIIASGLQTITYFIGSSGLFGTWLFGFIDKALLPFGIHHLIAFPIEYSSVGGVMTIDGVVYEGVRNIIVGQAGSPGATGYLIRNFTSGRILFQLAGLPGAAFAMYKCAKPENRKKVASLLIPTIVTLMLVGISEPIEYTFLFASPLLYWLVYAPLCGLCYVIAEVAKISINGHALFFMIPNLFQPQKVHALSLIFLLPATFAAYFFIFKFAILKLNIKTPGREDDNIKLMSKKEYNELKENNADDKLEIRIVEAFGGPDNIDSVACCATRLRVTVKDESLVVPDDDWKNYLEAMGCVHSGNSYQIIYGVNVNSITTSVKDVLGID
ncbi:PTS transporter subunit EIIC [Anaerorhabdus sp.]|uniref:PTS transporter subunit EIIC n=1 Tax=Anaerorhabdus sp. TaxID=1872524 RepID=UPI002FC7C028